MNADFRWRRLAPGHYSTPDRRWTILGHRTQWWLFREGTLWGWWEGMEGWRRYVPFRTMRAAVAAAGVADPHRIAA